MTKIFEMIERLEILHDLIKGGRTGTPDDLAKHLDISRATLYRLFDYLKSKNIIITYSRRKRSFVYAEDIDVEILFPIKVIKDEDKLMKINGGSTLFSFRMHYETEG
ncbi:winged helix-turn-helix domain-containing protein [Dysgonomonas sp. 25]|uniref:winged helix-turn-helix domain-containing protein n=1 Tax=Dysgonomonas sp. 25 TaxID=2302933 RepID=UPI0013D8CA51|nr:winged helix-turn-helix domain-containing protein [Dysgonomonas sp. 25]NDV68610.1 ArsR family transcriptional regulator [Dysgonomonas sp. 25]